MENKFLQNHAYFKEFCPNWAQKMKVSKFFSSLCNDKKLDDDISQILTYKKKIVSLRISIDPYDYLTMSVNNYGWSSCQRIHNGEYRMGPYTIMLDESTLMAYRAGNKEVDYSINSIKFSGNSKSWRQCVYVDKNTCAAIFGRQYPSSNEMVEEGTRTLWEETVSKYLGIDNRWWRRRNNHDGYNAVSNLVYHDVSNNNCNHNMVVLKQSADTINTFNVGVKRVKCVICGNESITKHGGIIMCDSCRSKR